MLLSLFVAASAAAGPGPKFVDPRGDAGGAPDITSVGVTSDAAGVTFTVHTTSAADWTNAAAILSIDNLTSGMSFSYVLHSEHTELTLDRSDGTHTASPAATWNLSGATLTIAVPFSELGNASRLDAGSER
jgi:hypothetical protein